MKISYELPEEHIALHPARPRDSCRLMVVHLSALTTEHRTFTDISEYLGPGDTVAVNDSSVIAARLTGRKSSGGAVEFLLLEKEDGFWRALGKPASRLREGMRINVGGKGKSSEVEIVGKNPGGFFLLKTSPDILSCGTIPLPPYIASRREALKKDERDYQTIFADKEGSVAAPTASLHFTPRMIKKLHSRGVTFTPITLHVGAGTFRPSEKPDEEAYEISSGSAEALNSASGICVCGTTVMRTLETACLSGEVFKPSFGRTGLYIEPGHRFRSADMFLTNFHHPGTPLLNMVAAYIDEYYPGRGAGILTDLYKEALTLGYRFLSYGDSMLLTRRLKD